MAIKGHILEHMLKLGEPYTKVTDITVVYTIRVKQSVSGSTVNSLRGLFISAYKWYGAGISTYQEGSLGSRFNPKGGKKKDIR